MKKTVLAAIAIAFLAAAPAMAQNMRSGDMMQPGMMTDGQQQTNSQQTQPDMQGNIMMGKGQGMMNGLNMMMGNGQGMMPCMMGGSGRMGGSGMMGGMGMMGGHGMMQALNSDDFKKYENFVKETREMRKKLHDLMFEYGEARWNPATTLGNLRKMGEEMNKLQDAIQKKMPK